MAETENDELATISLYGATLGSSPTDAQKAASKTEGTYYHNTITSIGSIDDLLKDRRVVTYITKAYGLDGAKLSDDTLRKILTSDPTDSKSFVNQKGQDPKFRDLAAAFNFGTDGKAKRVPAQSAQTLSNVLETTDGYVRQTMETDAGTQNEGVRLGLYFQRKAATIKTPLDILADKAIYQVVRTALGLPDTVAQADLDAQQAMIKKRIDVADFQDPKKVDKFLAQFAAMYDVNNNSATASSAALAILGVNSDTATAGTDQSLLMSMQGVSFR
jgi:hypothetical protein